MAEIAFFQRYKALKRRIAGPMWRKTSRDRLKKNRIEQAKKKEEEAVTNSLRCEQTRARVVFAAICTYFTLFFFWIYLIHVFVVFFSEFQHVLLSSLSILLLCCLFYLFIHSPVIKRRESCRNVVEITTNTAAIQ